ncbi:MAG: hypothetical protein K2M94_04515, partial [Paramuribaculum sp.]|nr:hypothetical protein [Paramuribaculum sp.]
LNNFTDRLRLTVQEYIDNEDSFCDDVQLAINPSDLSLEIADPDDDLPNLDYYPMMDLISTSTVEPGKWIPDEDAINEVAAAYIIVR